MKSEGNTIQVTVNKQEFAERVRRAAFAKISERARKTASKEQDIQRNPKTRKVSSSAMKYEANTEKQIAINKQQDTERVIRASSEVKIPEEKTSKNANIKEEYRQKNRKRKKFSFSGVNHEANTAKQVTISNQRAVKHVTRAAYDAKTLEGKAHKTVNGKEQDMKKNQKTKKVSFRDIECEVNTSKQVTISKKQASEREIRAESDTKISEENTRKATSAKGQDIQKNQKTKKVSFRDIECDVNTAKQVTISNQHSPKRIFRSALVSDKKALKTANIKEDIPISQLSTCTLNSTLCHKKVKDCLNGIERVVNTAEQVSINKQNAVDRAIKVCIDAKIATELARLNLDDGEMRRQETPPPGIGSLYRNTQGDSPSTMTDITSTAKKGPISKQQAIERAIKVASAAKSATEIARKNVDDTEKSIRESQLLGKDTLLNKMPDESSLKSEVETAEKASIGREQGIKKAIKVATDAKFAAGRVRISMKQ